MNLPPALIYIAIGVGAAVENIVPPVPADTFVLLGAFLACFWFWHGGADLYSIYSVAALSPVITGTFALQRAVV